MASARPRSATNLAVDLAGRGHSTLLIDLDLQFGDVGIAMGVEPERTIWDLVSAPGHLDGERLRAFLGESADGVHVLLAPVRPDQAESVTPELLDEVLQVAQAEFDVVIADTPPAFTPTSILAIDRADQTIMVGTLDLSGTKNMKIGLETLELMGRPRDRVLVVLNRADSKVGLTHARREGCAVSRTRRGGAIRSHAAPQPERRAADPRVRAEVRPREVASRSW